MKKVTVICTILNEEKTIVALLDALQAQTYQPELILIADGGSTDKTVTKIKNWQQQNTKVQLDLLQIQGNRSVGRNAAIRAANTTYIAITDAGCMPRPDWLKNLLLEQRESGAPVVAGYYHGLSDTKFEEAVVPYVLVMPDKVNSNNFLPATRSMLIDKAVWRKLDGFDESLSDNEDYDFARRMQSQGIDIAFTSEAMVDWYPRSNLKDFFIMIFRFARGDAQAKLFRPKVLFIFVRYVMATAFLIFLSIYGRWQDVVATIMLLAVIYSLWAVHKNVRYTPRGWYWLPVLQFSSDLAVMLGSCVGWWRRNFLK